MTALCAHLRRLAIFERVYHKRMNAMNTFQVSDEQIAQFQADGFLMVEGLYDSEEMDLLLKIGKTDPEKNEMVRATKDADGGESKLWLTADTESDDIYNAICHGQRMVDTMAKAMEDEVYLYHYKMMVKEPRVGGAWEWHQDYGYWYNQGFVFPRMISAFVALDPATKENGCLQVLRGSHLMGRLDHMQVGKQTGADPERVAQVIDFFDRVHVEMNPGDVLFFHCNLFHASDANVSDVHRRSFIMCYNALNNPQLRDKKTFEERPCPVSADDAILKRGQVVVV